jgi:hypothetical protein
MPRPDEITVLAGGWSAGRFDLQALPGWVIGVNDAALHARVDAIISMDRLWTEHRWPEVTAKVLPTWIRRSALKNIGARPFWLRPFECDHTSAQMTGAAGYLNGTNSGLCAVNLAFQFRPRLIRLYGMDLARGPKGQCHFHPPYPWAPQGATKPGKFAEWRRHLEQAIRQCKAEGIEVRTVTAPESR